MCIVFVNLITGNSSSGLCDTSMFCSIKYAAGGKGCRKQKQKQNAEGAECTANLPQQVLFGIFTIQKFPISRNDFIWTKEFKWLKCIWKRYSISLRANLDVASLHFHTIQNVVNNNLSSCTNAGLPTNFNFNNYYCRAGERARKLQAWYTAFAEDPSSVSSTTSGKTNRNGTIKKYQTIWTLHPVLSYRTALSETVSH